MFWSDLIWSVWVFWIVAEFCCSPLLFIFLIQKQIVWTEDEWSHNNWISLLPYRMTRIQFRRRSSSTSISRWWGEFKKKNNASVLRLCYSPLCIYTFTHTQIIIKLKKIKFWKILEEKFFLEKNDLKYCWEIV